MKYFITLCIFIVSLTACEPDNISACARSCISTGRQMDSYNSTSGCKCGPPCGSPQAASSK